MGLHTEVSLACQELSRSRLNLCVQHGHLAPQVYDVMKRVEVTKGGVIIKEGDPGDMFYVVEAGEYAVTIKGTEILKCVNLTPCYVMDIKILCRFGVRWRKALSHTGLLVSVCSCLLPR